MRFNSAFQGLNFIGNYVEIWCVPSATHVSYFHRNQNEVQDIGESENYFLFNSFISGK